MNKEINEIYDNLNLNPNIKKAIKDLNLEVVKCTCLNGFEKKDNHLIIWYFDNSVTDIEFCNFILQHPEIDTLYLGSAVTDNEDGMQIKKLHYLLTASHNIVPVIQNIELEDNSRYYVVDGMLIEKENALMIDYASGRKDKCIHVPNGLIGLNEHCFNYNAYVESIVIPSSLKCFDGLTSLPHLEKITMSGEYDSIYFTEDNILYKKTDNNDRQIFYITPHHKQYSPKILIKTLLSDLFLAILKEADNGRWNEISAENLYYEEEYDKIHINYYGGFYEQEWYIEYNPLPTETRLGYTFCDHWREFCASEISCKQEWYEDIIKLDCKNCPNCDNCKKVYNSNTAYINNLYSMMCDVVGNDSLMSGGDYFYLSIGWNDFNAILDIVIKFLDYALSIREKHPIVNTPLQPSLFPEISIEKQNISKVFPFYSNIYNRCLGYMNNGFVCDQEPPF